MLRALAPGIKPGSKGFKDLMAKVETSKGKLKGKK